MAFNKHTVTLTIILMITSVCVLAQRVAYESLDTVAVFKSLHEAMPHQDQVIRLDLSKQRFEEFPEEIFTMKNLQELKMNKCRLTTLPDRFDELPALQRLEVQHNELEAIPISLTKLKDLRVIDFADNIIDRIPDQIDRITTLHTLALWDNPITYYPERLTEMQQLKVLDLLNNATSRDTQERLKSGLPQCKIILSPPCACMDGDE